MYKSERIFTIKEGRYNQKKAPAISFGGKWLDDLGYFAGERILVKTINENKFFSFEISLLD